MRSVIVLVALTLLAALGAIALAEAVVWGPGSPATAAGPKPQFKRPAGAVRPAEADSLEHVMTIAAAFRESRTPADVAFDPSRPAADQPAIVAGPPKPDLQLVGIVWGRRPVALLDGLPAVDGTRAMVPGDTASGIRLLRLGRRVATFIGYDTTWTLHVREPQ